MDLEGLELQVDGVTRTFAEWTRDFVDSHYPNIGVDCYQVPALHFNRQKLNKCAGGSLEHLKLLHRQMHCVVAGDLAHTLVLEGLEELSHQLKLQKEGPLFIISSVNYDNYLARLLPSQAKKKKGKRKGSDNSSGKASLPSVHSTPQQSVATPSNGSGEFSETARAGESEQCQGKQLLPPRPADRGGQRGEIEQCQGKQLLPPRPADRGIHGEIDILLLHEQCGVVLIEVKSTGYPDPSWTPSEEELQSAITRSVQKAVEQLDRARDVLRYIMPDLTLTRVTLVVALPFLERQQLLQAMHGQSLDPCLRFLCREDMLPRPPSDPVLAPQTSPTAATASGGCPDQQDVFSISGLLAWWRSTVASADAEGLAVDSMRTIVGRICGLMSVVSVWTNSTPRVEVRTLSQALGEAGRRVSDIVLLPSQADLLAQQTPLRVWLTGPMGSGKTLMLQLKGRQWVREGRRVVVINVRTTARGRPIGHVLEVGIRQAGEGHLGAGSVDRCDVALDEYSIDVLHKQLADRGPMDNLCFVVDEILSDMSVIAEELALHYPASPMWCVASYLTPIPDTFYMYRLETVLRNPPSVQLMLKELDLNPRHKDVYTTRSAARGLPCDGPPVIFIEHSKHNTGVRHLDCLQCANELADIFETKLGLQLRLPASSESAVSDSVPIIQVRASRKSQTGAKLDRSCKTFEATPLSFRDVLILFAIPFSIYKHIANYHWEPSIPDILQFMIYMGKCRFLSGLRERGVPLKVAVDNTMREICFPPEDEVIMSEIFGAHSLERKVVVFVRGGEPLTQAEMSENLSRYQTVQDASSAQVELNKLNLTEKIGSPLKDQTSGQEAKTCSKELLLFDSLMCEIRDLVYPKLPASVSTTNEHAKSVIDTLLGNMVVAGTQSFVEGREQKVKRHREDLEPSQTLPTELRVGAEIRGNLPALRKVSQTDPGDSSTGNQSDSRRNVAEADSVFLVPDLQEDVVGRESEVRRVQRALGVLSEVDKDWELLAASRCLSLYISILP